MQKVGKIDIDIKCAIYSIIMQLQVCDNRCETFDPKYTRITKDLKQYLIYGK